MTTLLQQLMVEDAMRVVDGAVRLVPGEVGEDVYLEVEGEDGAVTLSRDQAVALATALLALVQK